jgi:uncharacterized damage-inducible protein DinB
MNSLEMISRLHQHRAWANHKLLDAAEKLPAEALRRPMAIGQGSIWKSLVHLYAAEYVWLEALLGDEQPLVPGDHPDKLPDNQEGEGTLGSLDELRSKWRALDECWLQYLAALKDDDLDSIVFKVSSGQGKRHATRRGDVLLHVCLHAHYTAAQVVNMLRQESVEPLPDVMLISLARQEMADRA